MWPAVCALDTGAVSNLIQAIFLDPSWLDRVRQHDMSNTSSTSDTKEKVSENITLHRCTGKSRTRGNFGFVNKLVVPFLLGTTHVDRVSSRYTGLKQNSSLTSPHRYRYQ